MKVQEKLSFAAKLLVEACLQRVAEIKQDKQLGCPGPKRICKEYGTVKLSLGRGSGNSTTAIDIAKSFKNPIIICPTVGMARYIKRSLNESNIVACSIDDTDSMVGLWPDAVIFDGSSLVSQAKIENIYDLFNIPIVNNSGCFIFLG